MLFICEQLQVIGSNGVMFMDLTNSNEDSSAQYFSLKNIRTHYLTHGDTIQLASDDITVSKSVMWILLCIFHLCFCSELSGTTQIARV